MRLLLLAGTNDAAQIAGALGKETRLIATASLPRARRTPVTLGLPTRIGGWGGEAAFRAWLVRERVESILDATHPFATRITDRAFRASRDLGIEYLQFLRPQWTPGPDDRWTFLNDCSEVGCKVPEGMTVLIDTEGRGNEIIGPLDRRRVHCRLREPTSSVHQRSDWTFHFHRGPYPVEWETMFFRRLGVDWLVLPNVGGAEERTKIEAARRMRVAVAMVRRPPQPEAPRATTISEVMSWVRRRL